MTKSDTPAAYTEAEKPRPLQEHMQRAFSCWQKVAEFAKANRPTATATREEKALFEAQLDALRLASGTGYWLYPLVEARRGLPR